MGDPYRRFPTPAAAPAAAMAKAHPEWQIVMVGPVAKIDRASLPRNSNIHYFGQQDYADLPGFIDGWDACLLPFALNQATRFISPTKRLEYMAAKKPIVSTPIVGRDSGGNGRTARARPDARCRGS